MHHSDHKWLTDELYKLGKHQAKIVSSGSIYSEDLLHTVLTSFITRVNIGKLEADKITKGLLFVSLKNTWLNQYSKESTQAKKQGAVLEHMNFLSDLEYSPEVDRKMSVVNSVYETLSQVEKDLFLLRFINRSNKKLVCTKLKIASNVFNKIEEDIVNKIKNNYNNELPNEE